MPPPVRKSNYTEQQVDDITEAVYRIRLDQDTSRHSKGNVERMLEKDREKDPNDTGQKLRRRAVEFYGPLTRVYLKVLGLDDPA